MQAQSSSTQPEFQFPKPSVPQSRRAANKQIAAPIRNPTVSSTRADETIASNLPLQKQWHQIPKKPAATSQKPARPKIPSDWRPESTDLLEYKTKLGSGSYGQVWLAEYTIGYVKSAHKFFHDPRERDHELGNYQLLRKLNKDCDPPNFLPLKSAKEAFGFSYISLQVAQDTIANVIHRSRTIQPLTMLHWMRNMADALAFLQEHELVHRDIVPPNVFIIGSELLLGDLGTLTSYKLPHNPEKRIELIRLRGGYAYMPPEKYEGQTADNKTDSYMAGLLFYHVDQKKLPYMKPDDKLNQPESIIREMFRDRIVNASILHIEGAEDSRSVCPTVINKLLLKHKDRIDAKTMVEMLKKPSPRVQMERIKFENAALRSGKIAAKQMAATVQEKKSRLESTVITLKRGIQDSEIAQSEQDQCKAKKLQTMSTQLYCSQKEVERKNLIITARENVIDSLKKQNTQLSTRVASSQGTENSSVKNSAPKSTSLEASIAQTSLPEVTNYSTQAPISSNELSFPNYATQASYQLPQSNYSTQFYNYSNQQSPTLPNYYSSIYSTTMNPQPLPSISTVLPISNKETYLPIASQAQPPIRACMLSQMPQVQTAQSHVPQVQMTQAQMPQAWINQLMPLQLHLFNTTQQSTIQNLSFHDLAGRPITQHQTMSLDPNLLIANEVTIFSIF